MSIEFGQQLSVWAVRLSLVFWFLFAVSLIRERANDHHQPRQRMLWTLATIFYLAHVILAFAYFHDWSHEQAVEHTAERTADVTGIHWGGGIWFNHVFTLICIIETMMWWVLPQSITRRPPKLTALVYGYCLFIIVNAAVVFVGGPVRWFSAAALLILTIMFFHQRADAELNH